LAQWKGLQLNSDFINTDRIGELFPGITADRLARWRWARKGPRYYKAGRNVLYTRADIEAFLEAHAVSGS
jgi:hypothetical protein